MDVAEPTVVGGPIIDQLLDFCVLETLYKNNRRVIIQTEEMFRHRNGSKSNLDLVNDSKNGTVSTLASPESWCTEFLVISLSPTTEQGVPSRPLISGDELLNSRHAVPLVVEARGTISSYPLTKKTCSAGREQVK